MKSAPARVILESDAARVVVAPERGARVTSLFDRRTGREWLAVGEPPAIHAQDASYGLAEAAGWDECFPTVASCVVGGRRLRDHGELWGRPWSVDSADQRSLTTSFTGDGYRFTRALALDGATLEAAYRVENCGGSSMPALWAMHPLFALQPDETIALSGARTLVPTYLSNASGSAPMPWPEGDARIPFPIDEAQSASAHFAGKFFDCDEGANSARLGGPKQALEMRWRGVAHVGLWLTYGGWPSPNETVHVAVEPTTSPDDGLDTAIARGLALALPPGGAATWTIWLTLVAGDAENET